MAQDEGRFGRISDIKRCWAPPGIRPVVPQQLVREYVYAYAAVAPSLGRMTAFILPSANTAMMELFLETVSQEFSDYFIIMQVDRAGWHQSGDLRIPENIRLVPQPAHSPEVNPVEHIWDEIREKFFPNRIFESLEQVVEQLIKAFEQLVEKPDQLRSMTNFPHLNVIC